jgi:uncharacterized protein
MLSLAVPALAVVAPTDDFFVADYANVLGAELEAKIIDSNADATNGLEALCKGAQVVVVTVQSLDGMPSDEYAAELWTNWGGIGSSSEKNGMLLLLAPTYNKAWWMIGSGISGYWTDSRQGEYLNKYFWDKFDAGDYDGAVSSLLEPVFAWYASYYNVNQGGEDYTPGVPQPVYPDDANSGGGKVSVGGFFGIIGAILGVVFGIFSHFFWIIVIVVVIIAISASNDRRRYNSYYSYMGMPMPPYHFWYMWGATRPHRIWYNNNNRRPPPGGGGFGGGGHGGGYSTCGNGNRPPSQRPSSGSRPTYGSPPSGGGFGGFGGSSGGGRSSGGGFGGFGGGSSGGGGRSGGGGSFGGGAGRR